MATTAPTSETQPTAEASAIKPKVGDDAIILFDGSDERITGRVLSIKGMGASRTYEVEIHNNGTKRVGPKDVIHLAHLRVTSAPRNADYGLTVTVADLPYADNLGCPYRTVAIADAMLEGQTSRYASCDSPALSTDEFAARVEQNLVKVLSPKPAPVPAPDPAPEPEKETSQEDPVETASWYRPLTDTPHAPTGIEHALATRTGGFIKAQCSTNDYPVVFQFAPRDGDKPGNLERCVRCIAILRGEPVPAHNPAPPTPNGAVTSTRTRRTQEARTPGARAQRQVKGKPPKKTGPTDLAALLRRVQTGDKPSDEELAAAIADVETRLKG